MKLRLFKNSLVQKLLEKVPENIDIYKKGSFAEKLEHEFKDEFFEIDLPSIKSIDFDQLNNRKGDRVQDHVDSTILFMKLRDIHPNLARDHRLWTTLCHMYALPYIRMRNPKIFDENSDEAISIIKSRFFITGGSRGIERTNSLSRLWWYGFIANRTGLDFAKAIHALVENTDHRQSTIERPTLAVCSSYMKAMTEVLLEYKESGDKFFNSRACYRPMMKSVFEIAGRSFYPILDSSEIKTKIREQIAKNRNN
jgi:hypothetical protein